MKSTVFCDVTTCCLVDIVTELLKALLGNGSVNTFKHTHAINSTVGIFCMWSAPCNSRRAVFCVVGARNSRRAMFSAWSVPRLYNGSVFVALISAVQSS
jgi:hypothetical protein